MTRMRRTTTTPLGHPVAGELFRDDMGRPVVPLNYDDDVEFLFDDPKESRDLTAQSAIVTNLLETALGLPAPAGPRCSCDDDPLQCAHQAARGRAEDDRDAFRGLLVRIVLAPTMPELQQTIGEARDALGRYDRRDVERGEAVSQP
ncbi:hypothetical protein [Nonomuraea sp. NPDC049709]|uniref:hypothetical protein n=1 Tax=Nonomuraea sp. NPDC049709 TaxID=3154736 RepID=UPI00342F483D